MNDKLAKAQHKYDREEPPVYDNDDDSVSINYGDRAVSDEEIEKVISDIAETGFYEDAFGYPKRAGDVYVGIAVDWVADRAKLPGYTYIAFLEWATAITTIAKYGIR